MTKQSIVLGTVFGVIVAVVLTALAFFVVKPGFGAPFFERTKWVSVYFSVGSTEQFHVDINGNASTTGDVTVDDLWVDDLTVTGHQVSSLNVTSTTTSGSSATLTQADLLAAQYFTVNLNAASSFTYTLPATSTLTLFLPNAGDSSRVCYHNATTTAGRDLIFAAGTGIDLEVATGTSVLELIGANDLGCFEFYRKSNSDLHAIFRAFDDSD